MRIPYIVGDQIYLRPLEREDINENYVSWLNDPDVNNYMEIGLFPTTLEELQKFYEEIISSKAGVMMAIIDRKTDKHIGNIKLGPINWVHRKATLGILIGDKQFWYKGIGSQVVELTVEYAFNRLNLRRIELGVYAEHEIAINTYKKVGFQTEGRFRQNLFHNGSYKDTIWMALLRSEFKNSIEKEDS